MADLVYNALGGTQLEPCPTEVSRWFEGAHCSRDDVAMWRGAAANLYALGILPLFGQVEGLNAEVAAAYRPQVVQYRTRFNALPARGSVLSVSKNLEAVSDTVALMVSGDVLVNGLRSAVEGQGATPVELAVPGPPAEPTKKAAWTRLAWPTAIVGSAVVVLGLAALAASKAGDSKPTSPRNTKESRRGRAA